MATSPTPPTLYDLILPGTHDSGAYKIDLNGVTPSGATTLLASFPLKFLLRRTLTSFSKTQTGNIRAQLEQGARFFDFRISSLEPRYRNPLRRRSKSRGAIADDPPLWLVHGMVAAVPLMPELHGIAAWQADWISRGFKPPCIVIVVRRYNKALYRKVEEAFRSTLGKGKGLSLYEGDAKQLRDIAYVDLPSTVIVGVPGIGGIPIGEDWGADIWIDTYKPDRKTAGLKLQVSEAGCRKGRDNMYVLAWTITPQTSDIVGRILTLGFAKKGLEITAPTFNKSFEEFAKENDEEMKEKVNCVFFDFFTSDIAKAVVGLNPNMPKPVPL